MTTKSDKHSWYVPRALIIAPALAAAMAGVVAGASTEGAGRWTLLANAALIVVMLGEWELVLRAVRSRSIGLISILFLIAFVQPVSLIIAAFIQGEVMYITGQAIHSHYDGGVLVAGAQAVFFGATCIAAVLCGLVYQARSGGWIEITGRLSDRTLRLAEILTWIVTVARVGTLLMGSEANEVLQYFLRLVVGFFVGVFFLMGVSLRRGSRMATLSIAVTAMLSALLLMTGSRADAIYPLLLTALGYAFAKPTPAAKLATWAGTGSVLIAGALFLGSVVRTDQRGRTAEAGLERLNRLSETVAMGMAEETAAESTIRRLLRNSTHAVITEIPDHYPHETDGLVKIPFEIVDKIMPRFNFSGRSERELPRNWMLNDLGFMVSWATSVELSLVADAWYRAGFFGLIVIGALVGALLGLLEAFIYRKIAQNPTWIVMFIFAASGMLLIEGRDFVAGLRSIVFLITAGGIFLGLDQMVRAGVSVGRQAGAGSEVARATQARRRREYGGATVGSWRPPWASSGVLGVICSRRERSWRRW